MRGALGKEESSAPKVQVSETPTFKGYPEDEQIAKKTGRSRQHTRMETRFHFRKRKQTVQRSRNK